MAYPHNWMHTRLPMTLEPNQVGTVPITLGPIATGSSASKTLQMHVECDPLPKVQSLSIMLNGTRLPLARWRGRAL